MSKSILVIDDEEKITKILSFILSRENFDVKSANNSQNGLRIAQEGGIDLIISDIMMPGMNGYELGEELKKDETTAAIPFIFLTAKGEVADKFAGYFVGAADYLTKPFKTEELISKVNRVLGLLEPDQIDDGTPAKVRARLIDSVPNPTIAQAAAQAAAQAHTRPSSGSNDKLSLSDVIETYQCMLTAMWGEVIEKLEAVEAGETMGSVIHDLTERYPMLSNISMTTSGPVISGVKRDLANAHIDDVNECMTELVATFMERSTTSPMTTVDGLRVMVFDENNEAKEFFSAILTGAGFAVESVENLDACKDHFTSSTPDLILMSAMMEESNVFEACKALKSDPNAARIPILMVSDIYDSENIKRSFAFGVSDYIVKPFSDSELVAAILSLVRE